MPFEVSAAEALRLIDGGALLVDVREEWEWEAGHAPQAVHLPMSRFAAEVTQLPKGRTLVCICHSGVRSALVAEALRDAGHSAINLVGGMEAWAADGLDVVIGTEGDE